MDEVAFGRYRLLSVIGEGGMGKVYKAYDTVIGRDVAIKVLPAELAAEPGYRERFRREAHTAARLTEPHIVPIHDTGEIDGQLYLVMQVIEGVDVQGLLQRDGPMRPQRAVHVVEQLAAALDAAHSAGLVHRDVKPSNALITGNDFVYLIDFGIAHDAVATKLTSTGMYMGTMAYMAPERFSAGTVDARSDVYALACLLHECLTGDHPYPGESTGQQIAGHLTLDPPRPSVQRPDVPVGFDEVIARGMAKNPDQRYQSAHELATSARHALTTSPRNAQTAATHRKPDPPAAPRARPAERRVPQRHFTIAAEASAAAMVEVAADRRDGCDRGRCRHRHCGLPTAITYSFARFPRAIGAAGAGSRANCASRAGFGADRAALHRTEQSLRCRGGQRRQCLRCRRWEQSDPDPGNRRGQRERAALHRPEQPRRCRGGQRPQRLRHQRWEQPGAETGGGLEQHDRAARHRPQRSAQCGGG